MLLRYGRCVGCPAKGREKRARAGLGLGELGVEQRRVWAGRPQTNRYVERLQQTAPEGPEVIVIGVDPHKQSHTGAAIQSVSGGLRGELMVGARRK
jgi:hypothetical protein